MEYISSNTKEITIYDIAKELNISPATVSRGLNDHPAVNKNTKIKIFETAKQMGYRSNTFASNLRRQRTNTIGVIVPHLNSYFISSVIAGMEKVANNAGYTLIISQSLESEKKEIANALTMFNSRVDGLMVSLAFDTDTIEHFKPFIKKGIPLIFFDRVHDTGESLNIIIDNVKAGYEATNHLIQQGCKRIAHITTRLKRNVYADRLRGYKLAMLDNNLSFQEDQIIITKLSDEESRNEAAQHILKLSPLPDGVFVANDAGAVSCIKAFKHAGLQVPEDIAVVGFNDEPIAKVIEPNLTTIHYPGYEMGEVAAKNLINHLNGIMDLTTTNTIILRSELIVRESSLRKAGSAK